MQTTLFPLWYKDAVIYELHVKTFFDSNNDGIGDFRCLIQKLDYIQDLGVNAVWLLPFYPSPQRDDGYDISDYRGMHPEYGTLRDFKHFVREAHRRNIRVITELVINHTSDQHHWFQAARRAHAGSAKRDFYVWSDTEAKFAGTRIIFTDTETSNWAWDPVYGYGAINVEAQQRDLSSLFHFMKRMLALRRQYKAFGRGSIEFLRPSNRKVLAYLRRYKGEVILAVANLSRFVQPVELDLSEFKDRTPTEMIGHTDFPAIGELPYFITLGPHSFYWFRLERTPEPIILAGLREATEMVLPRLALEEKWEGELTETYRHILEQEILSSYLPRQRRFRGKARELVRVQLIDWARFGGGLFILLAKVTYSDAGSEIYCLPIKVVLKLYRRLEEGVNPDFEISLYLTEQTGFKALAPVLGGIRYQAQNKTAAVAMFQSFVPNDGDGCSQRARTAMTLLSRRLTDLPVAIGEKAHAVLAAADSLINRFQDLANMKSRATRIRCHGDFHLGQVLSRGSDWVLLDFEGEPLRTLAQRREKHSPLKDVAGMLRSFSYAAYSVFLSLSREEQSSTGELAVRIRAWEGWLKAAFLGGYLEIARQGNFLPEREKQLETLLWAYVLDKAFYELEYELNNRPDWLMIPLQGILDLI